MSASRKSALPINLLIIASIYAVLIVVGIVFVAWTYLRNRGERKEAVATATTKTEEKKEAQKSVEVKPSISDLPIDQRAKIDDVYDYYWHQTPFRKHRLEGKRALFQVYYADVRGDKDSLNKPIFLYRADNGFSQPEAAFRLADVWGYKEGKINLRDIYGESGTYIYLEGTLRGPIKLKDESWSVKWANLTAHKGFMADHAVLVEESRIVEPPK
jgi:hypothetical protein